MGAKAKAEEKNPKKKVEKKNPKKKVIKKKSEPKEEFIVSQDNMEQEDPLELNDPPKIQKSREIALELNSSKIQKSREIALSPIVIKEEPIDYDSVTIKTEEPWIPVPIVQDHFLGPFLDNFHKKEEKDV